MLTYNPPSRVDCEDRDELLEVAVNLIRKTGKASASVIQRYLKLGYARSARILDQLETLGVIGPARGAKAREILIPHEYDDERQTIPKPKEPEVIEEEIIKWNKTKYADNKSKSFSVDLGVDENNKEVSLDLEKYGNLFIIGSQFTSSIDLINNILANSMAKYSPEELRILAIDGAGGDLIVPNQASHLLTPLIFQLEKSISALKWSVNEIERRMKMESQINNSKVLIIINSYNQIFNFSPAETEENLYRLISTGRKYGFYFVIGTDYPNSKTLKEIKANSPARLVFKPTDKKIAKETGIPESVDLTSPDEAILETMFEGKKKITIKKLNQKKIYEEIFR